MGNVKLGRYTASQEEMASEDYNEEEWENLSDVETALDNIGIKLRKNTQEYRETDDVLEDIHEKWDEMSQVDRNATVNALAGTRQREIVLTLFENWDQVEKFTQISADSYGTAEEKMTAFTDTIEAAQNRLTVAMERWVLTLQGSSAIKWFYDSLTFLVEQADKLIAIFGGLAVIANWSKIWNNLGITFTRVEAQAAKFGTMLDRITAKMGAERGFSGQVKSDAQVEFEAAYISSQQKTYGDRLNKLAGTVGDKDVLAQLGALQNMFINSKDTKKGLEFFKTLEDTGFQFTQELDTATNSIKDMTRQQQMAEYAQYYLTGAQKDSTGQILKQIQQGKISELTQQQLDEANAALAKARSQEYQQVNARMKANVQDWNQKGGVASATKAASMGAMSLGATIGGSKAGSMIGSLFGDSGEVIGMSIGMIAGPAMIQGLAKGAASLAVSGGMFSGVGAAIGAAMANPIVGILTAAVLAIGPSIIDWFLNSSKRAVEEAAEEFKVLSDQYSEMLNASTQTSDYDELVKGVNALGRNVSLTDEEYQEFLDISNELAAVYPELIQYTDDQGNKFIGLNGKVTSVTDAVNELVEAQQKAADQALLEPTLWNSNYNTAKKSYDEAKKNIEEIENLIDNLNEARAYSYDHATGTALYDIDASSSEIKQIITALNSTGLVSAKQTGRAKEFEVVGSIENINKALSEAEQEFKDKISNFEGDAKDAQSSLSSEIDAIFREMYDKEAYSDLMNEMSDDLKDGLKMIIQNLSLDESDADSFRAKVEDITSRLGKFFQDENIDITLALDPDLGVDITTFQASRQELLNGLKNIFGNSVKELDDGEIAIFAKFGFEWDEDAGDFIDTFDPLQQILSAGLDKKVIGSNALTGGGKYTYTAKELTKAYRILENAADDAKISQDALFASVVRADFSDSTLSELARAYEDYIEFSDELSKSDQQRFNVIKENLDSWADRLGEVEGNYEGIIDKIKELGDLDYFDTTPSEFRDQYEDYESLYDYLVNDYKGAWDPDQLGIVEQYSDLVPLVGDPDEMMARLKGFLDNGEKEYGYVWGAMMAKSEEGSKKLLQENAELVKKFAENYGIDLSNFDSLEDAKGVIDSMTTAAMEGNWNEFKIALQQIYADDLATFAGAQNQKVALLGAVLTQLGIVNSVAEGYEEANVDVNQRYITKQNDIYESAYNSAIAAGKTAEKARADAAAAIKQTRESSYNEAYNEVQTEYSQEYFNQLAEENYEKFSSMMPDLSEIIHTNVPTTGFSNTASGGSGSDAQEAIMNAMDYLDRLKDLHDLIDKEWEAMAAFDENTFTWVDTKYFDKMEDNLNKQLKEIERLKGFADSLFQGWGYDGYEGYFNTLDELGEAGLYEEMYNLRQATEKSLSAYGLTEADIFNIKKDEIEIQKELNNLDDEQVEDEISLLETRNASIYALLRAQEELIQTSDTEEELIERQADYNDLLEEEVDLRRQIAQFEQDTAERASKYVSGQAYSNSMAYDTLINIQKQALQQQADLALEDYNREFNEAYAQYVSEGMDKSLAYQMAQRSEGAREALETYFDALEAQGDLVVESFEAKMNELETQLEELEMTKPEEWGHIEDINPYYDSMISNIKAQIAQVEEALQNTEMMTDEQIEEWVGKYNDLVQQLQETQKDALEDTTNYQDEQFNALVDWIEEYKQSIEDLKKDVEDYYEPLIDAAQKYADDVAEANDLLELQQNLLNAQKEKQRVYREGKEMPSLKIAISVKSQRWSRPRKD